MFCSLPLPSFLTWTGFHDIGSQSHIHTSLWAPTPPSNETAPPPPPTQMCAFTNNSFMCRQRHGVQMWPLKVTGKDTVGISLHSWKKSSLGKVSFRLGRWFLKKRILCTHPLSVDGTVEGAAWTHGSPLVSCRPQTHRLQELRDASCQSGKWGSIVQLSLLGSWVVETLTPATSSEYQLQ